VPVPFLEQVVTVALETQARIYLQTKEEPIMSVLVTYPVEVKRYRVFVKKEWAGIALDGLECSLLGSDASAANIRSVGRFTFDDARVGQADFINRGGSLEMLRPLTMFSGVLDMLRNEKPVFLREDGTLATSLEPVGEEEEEPAPGE